MKFVAAAAFAATLMAGVSMPALAQTTLNIPPPQYDMADGTRTEDRAGAEASWRADAEFKADWGLDAINAEAAYARGYIGTGSKLGVMDSGTWAGHSEFAKPDKLISISIDGMRTGDDPYYGTKTGEKFSLIGGLPWFYEGEPKAHGTHVGGTMAALRNGKGMHGVAFDAVLIVANGEGLGPDKGSIDLFDPAIFGAQLDLLVAGGARVVNHSWGVPPKTGNLLQDARAQYYGAPTNKGIDALERAARAGVVMVMSAGNSRNSAVPDSKSGTPYFRGDPEVERNFIVVANMTPANDLNSRSTTCGYTKYWCVSAPGTDIYSTIVTGPSVDDLKEGYGEKSGTSMAAPHVSGAMGVLLGRFPYLDGGQVADILKTTSRDLGKQGVDTMFGWGLVDLSKAIDGPGQFLGRFKANLGQGVSDVWRNDISQEALDQRKVEEQAEITAWAARKTELDLSDGLPSDEILTGKLAKSLEPGLVEGKLLLEAAILAITPKNYTAAKLSAALAALRAKPAGAALLAAYEKVKPGWTGRYSKLTDYADFIASLGSDDAIVTKLALDQLAAVKMEFSQSEARIGDLTKRVYDAGLTKSGDGALGLAGKNSYLGDTIVDGGQLIVLEDGSIASASVVNASGYLGVDGKAAGIIVNSEGILGVSPTGVTGDVRVNKAGRAKVAGGGAIGALELDGGSAAIDGRAGMTRVNRDGMLRGIGRVAALSVGSGGTVAPGNSIGTLNVDGDALFEKGSQLVIESDGQGNMDKLAIGGKATLEGGTVTLTGVDSDGAVSPSAALGLIGKRQTVLTTAGGVTGRFEAAFPQYTFLGASLSYDADSVSLEISRNTVRFADFANTGNQKAAGSAIEALGLGKLLHDTVVVSTDPSNLSRDYDSLSGESHASLAAVATNDTAFIRDAMLRRMPHSALAQNEAGRAGETRGTSGLVMWGQLITGFADHKGTANVAAVKSSSTGFMTGVDHASENFNIGVAFGYLDTGVNVHRPGSGNNKVRSWHAGGYLGFEAGPLRLRGGGAYGWYTLRTGRAAAINAFTDSLSDHYNARAWQVFGELGLGFETGVLAFEPYANLTRVDYRAQSISESGGAAALTGRAVQRATSSTLGLRAATQLNDPVASRSSFARVNVGWKHDLDNDGALANLAFAGGRSFTVIGAVPGKDSMVVDAAVDVALTKDLDMGLTYGGQFAERYMAHAVKATMQLRF